MWQRFVGFISSILSESDGTGSTIRLCICAIVFITMGVIAGMAYKIHTPVTVAELDSLLSSAGNFIAVSCGPLYGINKIAAAVNKTNNNPSV